MIHRLCHVLLTYATRPMMWVLGGAYAIALAVMLCVYVTELKSPSPRRHEMAYPTFPYVGHLVSLNMLNGLQPLDNGILDRNVGTLQIDWFEPTDGKTGYRQRPDGGKD